MFVHVRDQSVHGSKVVRQYHHKLSSLQRQCLWLESKQRLDTNMLGVAADFGQITLFMRIDYISIFSGKSYRFYSTKEGLPLHSETVRI